MAMDAWSKNLDFSALRLAATRRAWNAFGMAAELIPRFFLYGESPRTVGDRFLHLEALDDRARPAQWNIRPHAHGNLSHLFHIVQGGGEMRADGRVTAFKAPCLLIVPFGVVHGFAFEPDTSGSVLTVSQACLQEIVQRETGFGPLLASPAHLALPDTSLIADGIERLSRELAWTAPGHVAAVEALLVTLLVEILRLAESARACPRLAPGGQAALVARFRERVEARYRLDTRIEAYAEALAVSPKRLRAACLHVAGVTPLRILHARLLLEAKRLLLYSNITVTEAAYDLGFSDPAYFSRFFTRGCGLSPRAFRSRPEAGQ